MSDTTYFNIEATGSTGDNSCGPCLKVIRREYEARIAALRSLVESLEDVKAAQKARIATLEAQVEQARDALERLLRSARRPECCWECHKGGQCQATDYIGSDCEPFALGCAALQALREGADHA